MERVSRTDYVGRFDSSRRTPQGGLKVTAYATRTGVFVYRNTDGTPRRELRHPEEVFQSDSLASLAGAPVTVGHPGKVGPDNYKTHSVGHVGDDVAPYKDKFVRTQLRVQEDAAVKRVDAGELVELSCGYDCDLEWKPGEYKGEKYDAIQRNIVYNHVALLPVNGGRAGNDVRIRFDGCDDVGVFSDREDEHDEEDCTDPECDICKEERKDCHEGQSEEDCHPKGGGGSGGDNDQGPRSPKQVKNSGKKKAYVVEHHTSEGVKATHYPSKKAAHEAGMAIRRAGGNAFAHEKDSPHRATKDDPNPSSDAHSASAQAHKSGKAEDHARAAEAHRIASSHARKAGDDDKAIEHGELKSKHEKLAEGFDDGKGPASRASQHSRRARGDNAKLDSLPMSAQIENDLAKSRQDAADLKVKLDSVTGERDALAAKVKDLSDTKRFDAAVTAACQLREDARSILGADAKFEGKTSRDIMIDALKKVDSDFKCDENTTVAYLQGRFDSEVRMTAKGATSLAKTRVIVDTTQTKVTPAKQDGTDENPVEAAQKRNQERSANAWKKDGK